MHITDKIKSSEIYSDAAFSSLANDVPLFVDLCDLFIEQLSAQPISADAVLCTLDDQVRRLSSFSDTNISYFEELLRGTILHTHSMLVNSLYSHYDEKQALENFIDSALIVSEYLEAIKQDYIVRFG